MGTSASPGSVSPPRYRGLPVIAALAALIALVGVVLLIVSGFGYRGGVWPLRIAFLLLRVGAWTALAGGVLSVLAVIVTRPGSGRRGLAISVLGVLMGLGGFAVMAVWAFTARHAAPIHDITTDVTNPPQFVAILPLRADARNPPQYGGAEVAAQQRAVYPDIGPVELPIPPGSAFRLALKAARDRGWDIVGADSGAGRIEATATTTWFGFKDDVVIRVSPTERGSRVDMRSESRVGGGDAGTNARRVRDFLAQLERTV